MQFAIMHYFKKTSPGVLVYFHALVKRARVRVRVKDHGQMVRRLEGQMVRGSEGQMVRWSECQSLSDCVLIALEIGFASDS